MTWAYYNDNDKYCAQWLRNLCKAGEIPPGDVDERDIREVQAQDLEGYGQVHLFAGIGGWSRALKLAGWAADRPAWTASCPCPPFSVAGKKTTCPACASACLVWCPRRTGYAICADCGHAWLADARHLWPEVWRLAAERRPELIFGEQVESIDAVNWLAGVRASMEILGYAVGAHDLPAAGAGAPQIRQRLWWVAQPTRPTREWDTRGVLGKETESGCQRQQHGDLPERPEHGSAGVVRPDGGLARADGGNASTEGIQRGGEHRQQPQDDGVAGGLGIADGAGSQSGQQAPEALGHRRPAVTTSRPGGLDDATGPRRPGQEQPRSVDAARHEARVPESERRGGTGFWSDFDLIPCADGKARRVESGTFPLATGIPNRVGRLRAYGNSICPPLAAEFVRAVTGIG